MKCDRKLNFWYKSKNVFKEHFAETKKMFPSHGSSKVAYMLHWVLARAVCFIYSPGSTQEMSCGPTLLTDILLTRHMPCISVTKQLFQTVEIYHISRDSLTIYNPPWYIQEIPSARTLKFWNPSCIFPRSKKNILWRKITKQYIYPKVYLKMKFVFDL